MLDGFETSTRPAELVSEFTAGLKYQYSRLVFTVVPSIWTPVWGPIAKTCAISPSKPLLVS